MQIDVQPMENGLVTIIMKNEHLEVWLSNLGATILKLLVKDRNGDWKDVVLGYRSLEDYETYKGYLGACVGRTANRIREGRFFLDGKEYLLPVNNGPNCNHGGDGFSFRPFTTAIGYDEVLFSLISPDGDQGYPGNLTLTVTYRLKENALEISYQAMSDADTLCNITNHSYFNLDGTPSHIGDHLLQVAADRYAPVDEDGLATGEIRMVQGTPFDFRTPKPVKDALSSHHPQIKTGKGLDHPFLFSQPEDQVVLSSPATGITMTVSTDMPTTQIYSANYLSGEPGKDGTALPAQSGICFETQFLADEINLNPVRPQTLLKKGEVWNGKTSFRFDVKQDESK